MAGLISLRFFFNYTSASTSTLALVLFGGSALGSSMVMVTNWFPHKTEALRHRINAMFVILLVAGTLVSPESFLGFQYRGTQRWIALWDNPNTFGMLMGAGTALALGALFQGLRLVEKNSGEGSQNSGMVRWSKTVFFIGAAGVMLFGLVKSYSRGAWLGAAIGIAFLIWSWMKDKPSRGRANVPASLGVCETERLARTLSPPDETVKAHLTPALSPCPTGGEGEAVSRRSFLSRFIIILPSICLILVSGCVLAFWNFRHAEHSTTRRAFSVANANDFSWRKRLSAYEGSLQMIADKPWFGFGWNQPEPIYDKFYRASKVDEGMAIQMNDYFTLGTTLGIPALGCFIAYIYLSLRGGKHRASNIEHPTSNEEWGAHAARVPCSASSRDTSTFFPQTEIENSQTVGATPTGAGETPALPINEMDEEDWLRMTCRAGAIVLLVGFFFDGGLFKLATGATFWILIELSSERGVPSSKVKVQSEDGKEVQGSTFKVQGAG